MKSAQNAPVTLQSALSASAQYQDSGAGLELIVCIALWIR